EIDDATGSVEDRLGDELRGSMRKDRGACAHEPEMVQPGTAEGGGEPVVGEDVPARVRIEGQLRGVEVPHRQRAAVAPRNEMVVLAAGDLEDVRVVPMHRHLDDRVDRHVAADGEEL